MPPERPKDLSAEDCSRMTYLDYINLFNRYDRQLRFSDGASRLYIKVLDVVNEINRSRPKGAPWVVDFQRSDGYLAGVYGCSINTVKNHRKELVERGLLSGNFGQSGRNSSGKYHLCYPSVNVSDVDTFTENNISDVDTINPLNLSTSDTISSEKQLNVSANVSSVDTLYIEEEKEESNTASAASTSISSSKKAAGKKAKPTPATHEQIAALTLPHNGTEFAEAWQSFYTTNSKQAGKAITAFMLMLKILGKYPEGYAVVMLERAIMGDWQGVENGGTARALAEWQAEQARNPTPVQAPQPAPVPELNVEFIAQQEAARQAERAEHFARFAAT